MEGDKLFFAKGSGYQDYEKKLPFTPNTLSWDTPVRESVPAMRFSMTSSTTPLLPVTCWHIARVSLGTI